MGESPEQPFELSCNGRLRVGFQGARVTSDGGLLLVRELDERLGFGELIERHLTSDADTAYCHRLRANEVRLWLTVIAYNLGNLWRRLRCQQRSPIGRLPLAAAAGENRGPSG